MSSFCASWRTLDPPVSARQGQERLGVGLLRRQAGDVVANVDLGGDDPASPDDEPVALDATDLAQLGPRCPMRARATDVRILLGIGEGPEHADLTPTMAGLW